MERPLCVLHVEDSEEDSLLLRRHLVRAGYDVTLKRVDTAGAMAAALDQQPWDIVLSDYAMPAFSGLEALRLLQQLGLDLPFIIVSGAIGEDIAVAAMRAGAHDYLMKGNLARLVPAIERELTDAVNRRERRQAETAYQESEAKFRRLMESAPDAMLTVSGSGNILFMNSQAEKMFGYRQDEVLAQPIEILVPERLRAAHILHRAAYSHAPETRPMGADLILLGRRRDGSEFPVEISLSALETANDFLISAVIRDITEKKRRETAQLFLAQASTTFAMSLDYETTLQNAARLVVPLLADWSAVTVLNENGSLRRVAVAHADAAMEDRLRTLTPSHVGLETPAGLFDVLRSGKASLVQHVPETEWIAAAGTDQDRATLRAMGATSALAVPMTARGNVIGVLSLVMAQSGRSYDIEDLHLAEEFAERVAFAADNARLYHAAEAERERLSAVLGQIPEGVVIAEAPDGRLTLMNAAAQRTWVPAAVGDTIEIWGALEVEYLDGRPCPIERRPLVRALHGETVLEAEMVIVRPDGSRTVLLTNSAPITNEFGQISGAVVVFQDITRRKTLEQQKDEFLSLAAHELKTPITAIKGHSQLLLRRLARQHTPAGATEVLLLQTIDERTNYLSGLVNELLDVSRIERSELALSSEPMDLLALLQRVLSQEQELHAETPFFLEDDGQSACGCWDRGRLEQVLINLLQNAAKYSPPGRPVKVTVDLQTPGYAHLSVQDQGIGIPEEDLQHLFERHFRASNVGMSASGMGLGLYISRQVVERHGGKMWAESQEGAGSTFHVLLPLSVAAAA